MEEEEQKNWIKKREVQLNDLRMTSGDEITSKLISEGLPSLTHPQVEWNGMIYKSAHILILPRLFDPCSPLSVSFSLFSSKETADVT